MLASCQHSAPLGAWFWRRGTFACSSLLETIFGIGSGEPLSRMMPLYMRVAHITGYLLLSPVRARGMRQGRGLTASGHSLRSAV